MYIRSSRSSRRKRKIRVANKRRFVIVIVIFVAVISVVCLKMKKIINSNDYNKVSAAYSTSIEKKNTKGSDSSKTDETDSKKTEQNKNEHDTENKDATENKDVSKNEDSNENSAKSSVENNNNNSKNHIDNKTFFKDDLFFGDSITEGLSFYDVLDEKNVICKIGATIPKAEKEIQKLTGKHPKNIFILLGNNDIDGVMTKKNFVSIYRRLVNEVKSKLPNTNIYVQSILPVKEAIATKQSPALTNYTINQYNDGLKGMAEEENVNYIDISQVLKDVKEDLYEPDGIHFKAEFYTLWTNYLKTIINK